MNWYKTIRWCSSLMILTMLIFPTQEEAPEGIISLSLRHMSIQTVNERQFSSYSHTRSLDLSSNAIYYIHKDGFCGMHSLFMLDLSYNDLQFLDPETFKCTPVLKRLYLKNNHMLSPEIHRVFLYSDSIKFLDISYCNFKEFSNEMFSGMPSLKDVMATENIACQKTIPQSFIIHIYCGVHNTDRHLKLNDTISNQTSDRYEEGINTNEIIPTITTTKLKHFESDPNKSATLSGRLNVADEETTINSRSITSSKMDETEPFVATQENPDDCDNNSEGRPCKDMDRKNLTSEDNAVQGWEEKLKEDLQNRDHNRIKIREMKIIPEYYYVGMENTLVLDLSDLNIINIHVRAFCGLDSLRILSLSSNNLHYLHPSTFKCTPRLESLDLSDNPNLTLYRGNAFFSSPSLKYLDISNCHFLSFREDVYSDLPQLKFINAAGNAGCPQIIRYFRGVSYAPCTDVIHSERGDVVQETDVHDEQHYENCVIHLVLECVWVIISALILLFLVKIYLLLRHWYVRLFEDKPTFSILRAASRDNENYKLLPSEERSFA